MQTQILFKTDHEYMAWLCPASAAATEVRSKRHAYTTNKFALKPEACREAYLKHCFCAAQDPDGCE